MARLWTCGFELQSATAGVEITSNGINGGGISTTTKRSPGAASLQVNPAAAFSWAGQRFATALTTGTIYARAYINISAIPTVGRAQILVFYDAAGVSAQGSVELDATGALQMWNAGGVATVGSTSTTLSTGTWYCVELSYNGTTGAMTARLDGTQFATGTGSTGTGCNAVYFGSPAVAATFNAFWDDMAINDTTGASQTSWPGTATRLEYMRPAGAGSVNTFATQTGGTAGAANNYTRVNETTPNDATSYNGASTVNQEDMFTVGSTAMGASDTVAVVQVGFRYAQSTADTAAAIVAQIKKSSAGTVSATSNILPNSVTWKTNNATTAQSYPLTLYNDPDGTAWTSSTIGAMQIGYKLTIAPGTAGRQTRVTAIWAVVESNAPAGTTYTQSLTASVSPAGAFAKMTSKALTSGMTSTGTFAKRTARSITASLSPAGAFSKRAIKAFTASLSPSGILNSVKIRLVSLTASLSPTGAITKLINRGLTASMTPTGTVVKQSIRALAASLSPSGAIAKRAARSFTASMTPTGAFSKLIKKPFTATLTSAGTLNKFISRNLTASLTPAGSLSRQLVKVMLLTANLTFTGNIGILRRMLLTANMTFSTSFLTRWLSGTPSVFKPLTAILQSGLKAFTEYGANREATESSPTNKATLTDPTSIANVNGAVRITNISSNTNKDTLKNPTNKADL